MCEVFDYCSQLQESFLTSFHHFSCHWSKKRKKENVFSRYGKWPYTYWGHAGNCEGLIPVGWTIVSMILSIWIVYAQISFLATTGKDGPTWKKFQLHFTSFFLVFTLALPPRVPMARKCWQIFLHFWIYVSAPRSLLGSEFFWKKNRFLVKTGWDCSVRSFVRSGLHWCENRRVLHSSVSTIQRDIRQLRTWQLWGFPCLCWGGRKPWTILAGQEKPKSKYLIANGDIWGIAWQMSVVWGLRYAPAFQCLISGSCWMLPFWRLVMDAPSRARN